jgi:hypothetical protein
MKGFLNLQEIILTYSKVIWGEHAEGSNLKPQGIAEFSCVFPTAGLRFSLILTEVRHVSQQTIMANRPRLAFTDRYRFCHIVCDLYGGGPV